MSLESSIDTSIRGHCQDNNWLWIKLWPFVKGFPDRVLLCPGGMVTFVELKRSPDEKLTYIQEYWCASLERMGFRVLRGVSSWAELEARVST